MDRFLGAVLITFLIGIKFSSVKLFCTTVNLKPIWLLLRCDLILDLNDSFALSFQVVSALAVDHSGSRVLTGSYDYTVRMYDFQGMNTRLASFRQLEPFEGHQVRNLSWSPSADRFLCVTGSAQAKVCCILFVVSNDMIFSPHQHT